MDIPEVDVMTAGMAAETRYNVVTVCFDICVHVGHIHQGELEEGPPRKRNKQPELVLEELLGATCSASAKKGPELFHLSLYWGIGRGSEFTHHALFCKKRTTNLQAAIQYKCNTPISTKSQTFCCARARARGGVCVCVCVCVSQQ